MSKFHWVKGKLLIYSNRGHSFGIASTSPGDSFPNGCKRVGTRWLTKAGSGGAKCRGLHGGNGGRERRESIAELKRKEQTQ